MSAKKIIVIGGSAAGAKAAAKARRMDEFAHITIIQKSPDLSMATCGYPYYVGGTFDDRNQLLCTPTGVIRNPEFFAKAKGITAFTETEAIQINRTEKSVLCRNHRKNEETTLDYDKLIIATGAKSNQPPIANSQLDGITTLLSLQDADYLRKIRDEKEIKQAVVIGGGLIGLETCEALRQSGLEITLVEQVEQVLPFLDQGLAKLVENHLRSQSVNVITETPVETFLGDQGKVTGLQLANGTILDCGLAVLAVGVSPNSQIAADSGLEIGKFGGIVVNEFMQTSDQDIYAAGDCVEIRNIFNQASAYSPMGDLANLQGRVAGENVIQGNSATFPGTNYSNICKIFEYTAGSTGLTETMAQQLGFKDHISVVNASPDKPNFMGAKLLISKMIVRQSDQQIIGFQCVGPGNVDRQVAMAAVAIQGKLSIEELVNLDLPYAPPYSSAIDHFITTAHIMQNKIKGRMPGLSVKTVWDKIQDNGDLYLLDARSPEEYEQMRIGMNEHLIPLGALRANMDKLPQDKNKEIICFCKISLRGYEAATILRAHGYTNVHVMEGGIMAWPYPREK